MAAHRTRRLLFSNRFALSAFTPDSWQRHEERIAQMPAEPRPTYLTHSSSVRGGRRSRRTLVARRPIPSTQPVRVCWMHFHFTRARARRRLRASRGITPRSVNCTRYSGRRSPDPCSRILVTPSSRHHVSPLLLPQAPAKRHCAAFRLRRP
jgi:hypothetical protein